MSTLAEAVLVVMTALSPESRWTAMPGHDEAVEARRERYASIARDIAHVAGNRHDAALLTSVAWHESGFAHDVDVGPTCYRGKGYESRCDAGRAVGLTQLHLTRAEAAKVRADRRYGLTLGLAAIKRSLATCAKNAEPLRFAGLSGSCARGHAGSRRIHAIHVRIDGALSAALAGTS